MTTLALLACKVSIGPDDTKVSVAAEGHATEPCDEVASSEARDLKITPR